MKRAAAKISPETPQEAAEREFCQAIEALRNAKDGGGLLINLMPNSSELGNPPCSADFHRKIGEHTRFLHGCQFGGIDGRLAFARNLALLSNAWASAIKREIARKAPPAL